MITVFTGAGFSHLGGVPLASQLFDEQPAVDRISRQRLIERVVAGWNRWHASEKGTPEEYLAVLEARADKAWQDAVWFVGLRIALDMGNIEMVGARPTVVRHNIDRTTGVAVHEKFWGALFRLVNDATVITTNYDILCERGLRIAPRPRKHLPGFNYGNGVEQLTGGGYPSYSHIQKVACQGRVPVLKLHGSVSWSMRDGRIIKYHDCRPAIRGDAAIIAPVTNKQIPEMFQNIWLSAAQALASTSVLLVIGYSLPPYDLAVRNLIKSNLPDSAKVHVFDPYLPVASRYAELLPCNEVMPEPGLPRGADRLVSILDSLAL